MRREEVAGQAPALRFGRATRFEGGLPATTPAFRLAALLPPRHRDDWSRVIYAIEDITEQRQAEEQLRQSQKMEAIGQLAGGVAHDFNNMLQPIIGLTRLTMDELPEGGVGRTNLEKVLEAGRRVLDES